jgi:GNAT superfamily N-acetyltransferase
MLNNNEEFIYTDPEKNYNERNEGIHTIDLVLDGEVIGSAELTYYSKPIPLYQLSELYVEFEYQGQGRASAIMDQVESFIKKRGKAGTLVDGIMMGNPASGMYKKRGWLEVPSIPDLFVFNLPKGASLDDFVAYPFRQTDPMERESWQDKIKND